MTRILVLSDTHWDSAPSSDVLVELNKHAKNVDYVLHAGNYGGTGFNFLKNTWEYKNKLIVPVCEINNEVSHKYGAVVGNDEDVADLRGYEKICTPEGIRIGLVHDPFKYSQNTFKYSQNTSKGTKDHWDVQENIPQEVKEKIRIHINEYEKDRDHFGKGIICLSNIARDLDVDVLVFGHFHHPLVVNGERLIICPGCSPGCDYLRNSPPTVGYLRIDSNDDIRADILFQEIEAPERIHAIRLATNHVHVAK